MISIYKIRSTGLYEKGAKKRLDSCLKGLKTSLLLALFLGITIIPSYAQLINLGYKYQEKGMFNATINYPMIYDRHTHHELMLGIDYTTKNTKAPSGISPQLSYGYFLVDNSRTNYLLMAGLSTGYQVTLHNPYKNQFRVSPYIYTELVAVFNLKVGYDYMMPLQKGYPFISIGIGGLHMFRHLNFM